MSECERIERQGSVSMTFVGCAEHGDFTAESLMIDFSSGVNPLDAADVMFSAIEEIVVVELVKHRKVQGLLTEEHMWQWSEDPEPLPERAQKQVARLLANQMMLGRVAGREYGRAIESVTLSLPRLD